MQFFLVSVPGVLGIVGWLYVAIVHRELAPIDNILLAISATLVVLSVLVTFIGTKYELRTWAVLAAACLTGSVIFRNREEWRYVFTAPIDL